MMIMHYPEIRRPSETGVVPGIASANSTPSSEYPQRYFGLMFGAQKQTVAWYLYEFCSNPKER